MNNLEQDVAIDRLKFTVILPFIILFMLGFFAAAHAESNPWKQKFQTAALPSSTGAASTLTDAVDVVHSISYEEVEGAIKQLLQTANAGEELIVSLPRSSRQTTLLTHRSALTYEISDPEFNADKLKWTAILYPFAGERPLAPIKLNGSFDEMVSVPILNRRVRRDDIISLDDIELKKMQASRLKTGTLLDISQMIGLSPLRTVSPKRPIRAAELKRPSVVKKNDQLTLQFVSAGMEIRAVGEAMDEGAEGDMIRVRNKDSNQPVKARIIAAGLAEVLPM